MAEPNAARKRYLPQRWRQWLLTTHIILSVGLLGDSAGFLAVAIRAASATDPQQVRELMRVLDMFSIVFGIPLSVGAIVTGVALGLGSKWGVFSYPWVTTKLLLNVSVMVVGALVIGPALKATIDGTGDGTQQLVAAAAYDVAALILATGLSVFKPGRAFPARALQS